MIPNICIINENKICDECGECNFCDINPDKICDNCGKCLVQEGYDYNAIQIDDLITELNGDKDFESEYSGDRWKFLRQDDDSYCNEDVLFIDDLENLNYELEDENNKKHNHDCKCGHHDHI